ncbi:MAG TPA: hypothetical protein VJN96_01680 [Vicinamibacterales bacterium]|nr:hypothetical protein [Vicinamibacterales bacterium]
MLDRAFIGQGLTIVLVTSLAVAANAQRRGQPEQPAPTLEVVDYAAPPATLEELWQHANLIVRARVVRNHPAVAKHTSGAPTVLRYQELDITEVLKEDRLRRPGNIQVKQEGGSLIVDGRQVETAYTAKLLQAGDDVVLFLNRDAAGDGYWIAYGSVGVIWIGPQDSDVSLPRALAKMPTFAALGQIKPDGLMSQLRTMAKKNK